MRTFILYSRKGHTDENFSLDDLPSSGGRMDLIARFITSCLFISHKMRQDVRVFIVLNGPPNPPVTLSLDSSVTRIGVDERSVSGWIRKALSQLGTKKSTRTHNGIVVQRKSFQELVKEVSKEGTVYVLHEKGSFIKKTKLSKDTIFIIGDDVGLPDKEEKFALRKGKKLSLGKIPYLATTCVGILHWQLDHVSATHP